MSDNTFDLPEGQPGIPHLYYRLGTIGNQLQTLNTQLGAHTQELTRWQEKTDGRVTVLESTLIRHDERIRSLEDHGGEQKENEVRIAAVERAVAVPDPHLHLSSSELSVYRWAMRVIAVAGTGVLTAAGVELVSMVAGHPIRIP